MHCDKSEELSTRIRSVHCLMSMLIASVFPAVPLSRSREAHGPKSYEEILTVPADRAFPDGEKGNVESMSSVESIQRLNLTLLVDAYGMRTGYVTC